MNELIIYRSPKDGEEFVLANIRAMAMRESLENVNRYDEDRAKQRLLQKYDKEATTVIESNTGDIIGFYSVLIDGSTAKLDHLYLEKKNQGNGLGTQVLTKICHDYSGYDITLYALKESKANLFYKKNGFIQIAELEWDNQYWLNKKDVEQINIGTMPILIREMNNNDLDEVSTVFCETFSSPPWSEPWTVDLSFKRIIQMFMFPGQKSYIAIQNGIIVAFVIGTIMNWHDSGYYEIKELCVKNEYKRNGLGTKLIKYVEEELKLIGVSNIMLFTTKNSEANQFYRKNGYSIFEEMEILQKTS